MNISHECIESKRDIPTKVNINYALASLKYLGKACQVSDSGFVPVGEGYSIIYLKP